MRYRTGDKVASRKMARLEARIVKEIATPKHKYLNLGRLSVHYDCARDSYNTEGIWHAPIHFPAQIRILYLGRKAVRVYCIRWKK